MNSYLSDTNLHTKQKIYFLDWIFSFIITLIPTAYFLKGGQEA